MIDSSQYPVRERIVAPLAAAIELLLSIKSPDAEQQIASARRALERLEQITTPAQELLDDFVSGFGPIEGIMGNASSEAWRGDGHGNQGQNDAVTVRSTAKMQEVLLSFVAGLAANDQVAEALVAQFMDDRALDVKKLFDLAQEDGWKHGDYRSGATDHASGEMATHIRALAATALKAPTEEQAC